MILVIHYPAEQDAPSTILYVLEVRRWQLYQQLKSKAENYDFVEVDRIIRTAEKADQLTKLPFAALLANIPRIS